MWRLTLFAGLLGMLVPTPSAAVAVPLVPGNTEVGLTVFALGLFPQSGRFDRFSGLLALDPAHPADCRVTLEVQVASLEMDNAATARLALGASMLDAAHFPTMTFAGVCDLTHASGQLTMHGVTRGVALTEIRTGARFRATGALRRQDFGVDGLPGLIGSTAKIVFSVTLPAPLAAQLPKAPP